MAEDRGPVSIRVNGEETELDGGRRLTDLLASLDRDPRTVAVELNGAIVPRGSYGETELRPGDRLEIVHFVQGG